MVEIRTAKSPHENWRFIDSGPLPGAMNMALDMAMTQSAVTGASLPTLRVYGWKPPAISLGYHQSEKDIDLDRCQRDGIDVVLRPTGGRAILHHHELTYAVSIPPTSMHFAPDIHTVYGLVSRGLVAALRKLNIDVEFDRAEKTPKDFNKGEMASLCYASSVKFEINIGKKKLVGSAQRRINGGILQHGSILLGDEHLRIVHYLPFDDEAKLQKTERFMRSHTVALNQVSKVPISYQDVAASIKTGFSEALGLKFIDSSFNEEELKHARALEKKFSILSHKTNVR